MAILSVRGKLSEADLLPAARYGTRHRATSLKVMLWVGCVLLLAGVGSLAMGQWSNAVVPILLGSFYAGYVLTTPRRTVRKQLKSAVHMAEEATYDFDHERFTITRPSQSVTLSWSAIHSVVELRDGFAVI
jgi:hypothetical protein